MPRTTLQTTKEEYKGKNVRKYDLACDVINLYEGLYPAEEALMAYRDAKFICKRIEKRIKK